MNSRVRFHKRRFSAFLLLLAMCLMQTSNGLQVSGLYAHRVEVENESNSERNRAFQEALSAVIVKVTGEERWLLDPRVISAIENAQSFVEAVSYSTESVEIQTEDVVNSADDSLSAVPPSANDAIQAELNNSNSNSANQDTQANELETTEKQEAEIEQTLRTREQRYVDVNFSSELVDDLLLQADIPLWDSNRPSVLVWMALQNEEGDRSFLSRDFNPEIVELIQDFADSRGLPIIFPVFDFEDQRNLPVDVMWSLDRDAIASASQRYGADSVLSGRLHFTAGGELLGLWQFEFQDNVESFDGFDVELENYLNEPLDRVTTQLANYYAIVPNKSELQSVRVKVEGVQDLQDYSSLVNYLSNLGLVETVTMNSLEGQQLEVNVGLLGDAIQLSELIGLDRDLLPIQDSEILASSSLHYRWTR